LPIVDGAFCRPQDHEVRLESQGPP